MLEVLSQLLDIPETIAWLHLAQPTLSNSSKPQGTLLPFCLTKWPAMHGSAAQEGSGVGGNDAEIQPGQGSSQATASARGAFNEHVGGHMAAGPSGSGEGSGVQRQTGDEGSGTEAEGRRSRKRAASASRNLVESAAKRRAVASPSRPTAQQQLQEGQQVDNGEASADAIVGMEIDGVGRTTRGGAGVRRRVVLTGAGRKSRT